MRLKQTERDETLKTEFIVEGSLETIYQLVEEVITGNNFSLVPFRFSDNANNKRAFQVISVDSRTQRKFSCGTMELIKHKEIGQTLFRLDSTKGTPNTFNMQGKVPLERVFYLVLQQFIQHGIPFGGPGANKKDQAM